MTDVSVTVLVPVFNEVSTVREVLARLLRVEVPCRLEVIVIDDGSSDGSGEAIAASLAGHEDRSRLVTRTQNGGKGVALVTGLAHASGTHVAVLDADLELKPEDLPSLLQPITQGCKDAMIGVRRSEGRRSVRMSISRFPYSVANAAITLGFNLRNRCRIRDVMSGYKILPRQVWLDADFSQPGFAVEIEMARAAVSPDIRLGQLDVAYLPRGRKEGKKIKASDAFRALVAVVASGNQRTRMQAPTR